MPSRKFVAKPGQVDFTNARWAPTLNCVVSWGDKILLVRRSAEMNLYPNQWNGIAGFLDDAKSLEEKAQEELLEEAGIRSEEIVFIRACGVFDLDDPAVGKTWIVHVVRAEVRTGKISLDWEASEYKWVLPVEIRQYDLVPGFEKVLAAAGLRPDGKGLR